MGRKRKPAKVKQGKSENKQQLNVRAVEEEKLKGANDNVQNVPQYLDSLAQIYYQFLVTELEISGLLGNIDIPLLEHTADTLSKMRQLDEQLNKDGLIIQATDRYGNLVMKEHPAFGAKQKLLTQFRALSALLGMSPSSRAQLAGMKIEQQEQDNDPLLQLLKGGKK